MSELQTGRAAESAIDTTTPSLTVPLALIADADPRSAARRAKQLQARGFRVALARTSFEAIVKASCQIPDVILVAGSIEDASDTTTLLATCPATAHIPIVHLTRGKRLPVSVRVSNGAH
jgi:CheY-like chemotaxis protein